MQYREDFVVFLDVETSAGHRYIYYSSDDYDDLGSGEYVHYGLGSLAKDGQWHTFSTNLEADLENAQPDVRILAVCRTYSRASFASIPGLLAANRNMV